MLKKMLIWGFIAFLIFFIAFRPSEAIGVSRTLLGVAGDILGGVGRFFGGLLP